MAEPYHEKMRAALGFRTHSGWAAMVAVAGSLDAPRILERRRIVIADPQMPGSKQPYHAAAGLPVCEAEALLREAIESSRALASEAISAAIQSLQLQGQEIVACGMLLGSGKALPPLDKILASHAMIHTAEGNVFREVIGWAALACRLPVTTIRERKIDAASLQRIGSLGRWIGPPWTQDQKYATLAALAALLESA